jgi:uncharacterized protein YndB with AHSA1/START domain
MSTACVTPDQDTVVVEIQIAAPPERVFSAITDPQQVPQWWGDPGMYRTTQWQGDLRRGGKWRSDGVGADGKPFHVAGEYLEYDPPKLLVHTWVPSYMGDFKTVVRWELKQEKGGTHVTVRHSGFAGQPEGAKSHGEGWTRVLGWMQKFVEGGKTIDSRG